MDNYDYKGEKFLNKLYKDLHVQDVVMHTATPSDKKEEKVKKYLDRLERVENIAKSSNRNGIELLKRLYYKKYVIKAENIPESYFELQKKMALERGYGHIEIDERMRQELIKIVIEDQKKSLDMWLDYFLSEDCLYPEWFKYYAFQGMLNLGSYDKEKNSFNRRTETTTNIFVDLNREALALVYDNLVEALDGKKVDDEVLAKLLDGGNFSKLYSYFIKKLDQSNKNINGNEGIWIKYNQGSEPYELVKSLEGKGTGWCTAGFETAKAQLENGDFYVYYTKDSKKEYKQPRIAIRMEANSIGEIRGIAEHQNLESEMEEVLNKKLEEFQDKDNYLKKLNDMKILTGIYNEYRKRELTIDEIKFLYELDSEIEGFGYQKDPRIDEIISERNPKEDLSKVFNCSPEEISNNFVDLIDGKKLTCFVGYLGLDNYSNIGRIVFPKNVFGCLSLGGLTSAKGLKLPESVSGDIDLRDLKSAEGLVLPKTIGGSLVLSGLESAEGLVLPESIGCVFLSLRSLKKAEGLVLPKNIGGSLDLSGLESAEGLVLPETMGGFLDLSSLENAEGLVLPKTIGGDLDLSGLESAKGLVLPETIGGTLDLRGLESAEGLVLPKTIGGDLGLRNLKSAEGLVLPETIGGFLDLNSLTYAKGLTLPKNIGDYLKLNSLERAKDLVLPETIGSDLYLTSLTNAGGLIVPKKFTYGRLLSYYITMDDLVNKSLENKEKGRQRGYSSVVMLGVLTSLASIGLIILGVFLTK